MNHELVFLSKLIVWVKPVAHNMGNAMMIDKIILDSLTAQAKASPRLRMNLDLRNSPADGSQRMLNAQEPKDMMED